MAKQLIRQLTDDFDPGQFKDEYHKALKKLIRKKVFSSARSFFPSGLRSSHD